MAQHIELGQQQPISADIFQLATTHNLGTPLAEHKARLTGKGLFAALVVTTGAIFLVISIIGFFHRNPLGTEIVLLLCSFALIGYGLLRAWTVLTNRSARIYQCAEGLMHINAGKAETIRWDEIAEIRTKIRINWPIWLLRSVLSDENNLLFLLLFSLFFSRLNRQSYTLKEYILCRPDGSLLRLDMPFERFDALQDVLEREVRRRLLPGAITMYNAGTPVNFGKISVSAQGISVYNGRNILPWNELGQVEVDVYRGFIIIKKAGKFLTRRWAKIRSSKVPNACVFEALVNYVRHGQQAQA